MYIIFFLIKTKSINLTPNWFYISNINSELIVLMNYLFCVLFCFVFTCCHDATVQGKKNVTDQSCRVQVSFPYVPPKKSKFNILMLAEHCSMYEQ